MEMVVRTKYIVMFFALLAIGKLQAQNDSVKIRSYAIGNAYFINYFGLLKPNLAIVPCEGGVFVPNWNLWYFKTQDSILSAEPSYLDTTLLITRTSKKYFELVKVSNDTLRKKMIPLVLTRGFVFYAVPSNFIKGLSFFVVGCYNKYNICKWYDNKVDTIFHSDKMIEQIEVINKSTILFCYDSKLVIYPLYGNPSVLFDAGKYKIFGFTSDEEGGVFISTDIGIIKIDHTKQQYVFPANAIKGKLRYSNKEIYVLDKGSGKLSVIPLNSARFLPVPAAKIVVKEQANDVKVSKTLTNTSVIDMVNAGLSDDIIINLINNAEVSFDVSVDAMIALSGQKVSSVVILSMKNAMKKKNSTNLNENKH
jgi:hypothetical protein